MVVVLKKVKEIVVCMVEVRVCGGINEDRGGRG